MIKLTQPVAANEILKLFKYMYWRKSEKKNSLSEREEYVGVLRLRGDISISSPHIQDLVNVFPQIKSQHFKALIISLETTGGTLACADNIMGWIDHLFRAQGLPVVCVIEEQCLSAGLAVAARCDYILAQPSAMFGAFGVMMTWPGSQNLRAQLGLLPHVFKSAPLKDFSSPYREPMPDDEKMILELLNDFHEQFANRLSSIRPVKSEDFMCIADGRLFSGRHALKIGMIDQFGGMETAFKWLHKKGHLQLVDGKPPQLMFLGDSRPTSDVPSSISNFVKTLLGKV